MIAHTNAPWTPVYARDLVARGHDVLVASFAPDEVAGVRVAYLGPARYVGDRNKHLFVTRLPKARRLARDFDPDVVFAPYLISNGFVAALATRAPLVVSARGGDLQVQPEHPWWRRRIADHVVRGVCRRARRVHCVSENLQARLLELGVAPERIVQFPVGVNVTRFRRRAFSAAGSHVVSTRRHVGNSDLPTLIDALQHVHAAGHPVDAAFAGAGRQLEANRARVRKAGLADRVHFVGHLAPDALAEELRRADVYVSTSLSDGTSSSLLEAIASGLVPVVTRIDANLRWIEDGQNGLLFQPGDAHGLAKCLIRAFGDAGLRARAHAQNPIQVARDANVDDNLKRLALLLEETAGMFR